MSGLTKFFMLMIFGWVGAVHADQLSDFAVTVGRTSGVAVSCKLPKEKVEAYTDATTRYARARWAVDEGHRFIDLVAASMVNMALLPVPDEKSCKAAASDIMLGSHDPEAIFSHTYLHGNPGKSESGWDASSVKKKNYVKSVGARVCLFNRGTFTPVIEGMYGAIKGKPVPREFYVQGFTEAVSEDRIKVLIASIRSVTELGEQYLSELPPSYTKGQHIWADWWHWHPCD